MWRSGVDILSYCACEQEVVLQNDVDVRTQFLETQLGDIVAINDDSPIRCFENAQQTEHHWALSAACATNDAYLLSSFDCEAESFEDIVKFWPIASGVVFEGDLPFRE